MTARCAWCGKLFDTHDGGARCPKCANTCCPDCEWGHFTLVPMWRSADGGKSMTEVDNAGKRCNRCGTTVMFL